MIPGGKGANQAVAVARLGVPVQLVGRVGQDSFGQVLLQDLQASGVGCDRIRVDATTHSGVAMITVNDAAENTIIVIPGANGQISDRDVDHFAPLLPHTRILLLQLEIPLPAVMAAAQAAQQAGVLVILDPAPVCPDFPDRLYSFIDIFTPNQLEASQLTGVTVSDWETATQAALLLRQRGAKTVIVKLGQQGALCMTAEETLQIPAFAVEAVDTVAAGDAFNGGLAAALSTGLSLPQALTQATAVAALSVTQKGAQPSLPTRSQLLRFLATATHAPTVGGSGI
jgi:ribokinase